MTLNFIFLNFENLSRYPSRILCEFPDSKHKAELSLPEIIAGWNPLKRM